MNIRIDTGTQNNTPKSTGVWNYTYYLYSALLASSIHVDTLKTYSNFLYRLFQKLNSYNLAPPIDFFSSRVDLTIWPNFAIWPTIKSRLNAVVIHDLTYLYYPEVVEGKNLAHLKRVVPRSISMASFIITVSNSVKSEIIKEFRINPNQIIVTTIPPDESFYLNNNNEIHNRYKIPTKKFIYFIGNLEPRKDLITLISAYRKLPANIKKDYSLVMAGSKGWKTEKTQQAIDSARAAGENVVHVGFVDKKDAAAFYQKASVFVMPSIYEGFGMPVLESMASGCPVIASNIPVLREVGGKAAIFANVGDSDDFCEKIQYLLSKPSLQKELVAKGKKQLLKFSWNKNVQIIIDKVNSITNS